MKFKYFIPSIIIMILIFWFSHQTGSDSSTLSHAFLLFLEKYINIETTSLIIRKVAHISEYILLYLSLIYGFYKNKYQHYLTYSLLFTFFYACSDEFHQLFINGRNGSFIDICIDMIGCSSLYLILKRRN